MVGMPAAASWPHVDARPGQDGATAGAGSHRGLPVLRRGCFRRWVRSQGSDTPGPTASAQAQAVADAFVARANEAVDTGRTLQQAVADAQSAGQRASGFITQPLYVSDEGSADGFHETIAVVNDRGVCYSFTVALGSTHVTGTGVSVMDACPPTAS